MNLQADSPAMPSPGSVPHVPGTVTADEEVPRGGAHVTRVDRIVTGGGGVLVWRARTKAPGSGEGSSGLRFDILDETDVEARAPAARCRVASVG